MFSWQSLLCHEHVLSTGHGAGASVHGTRQTVLQVRASGSHAASRAGAPSLPAKRRRRGPGPSPACRTGLARSRCGRTAEAA